MAQFARPVSDTAVGSWTTTPLWSKVDEAVAGSSGNGVVILSEAVGNNTDTSTIELALSSVTDPAVSTGHIIRVRWRHPTGNSLAGNVRLRQGTTTIATLTVTPDVTTTENEASLTLSGAEADSITNYGNLNFQIWGRGTASGPGRSLEVESVELEVPNASGGTTFFQTIAATAVGVAVLATLSTFLRTLAATAVGVATLTAVKTFLKTLAAVAAGAPALLKGMFETLSTTGVGVATLSTSTTFLRAMAATAVGVATLAAALLTTVSLAAAAVGVATLSTVKTFARALASTLVGVASLSAVTTLVAVTSLPQKIGSVFSTGYAGKTSAEKNKKTEIS